VFAVLVVLSVAAAKFYIDQQVTYFWLDMYQTKT
jgi:hypothetical protein